MDNITLMQFFHWYYPDDGSLWNHFKDTAPRLAKMGINAVWLPPATKSTNEENSTGYDIYDLFDLGEFDQKGRVRTKYGTRDEYTGAIAAAHGNGIQVFADAVLNHKAGADEKERVPVRKVNPGNRNEFISDVFEIEAYTKFIFPGRHGKYSGFIWDWHCFSGVDWAADTGEKGVYSIQNEYGEGWQEVMETELGNYDYLMYDDIDYRNPHVREEVKYWGKWYIDTTGVDGFRLDAVKHISPAFIKEWVEYLQQAPDKPLFFVAEYWSTADNKLLLQYIEATGGKLQLFDAPLHERFYTASHQGKDFDLRTIFDNTLVQAHPTHAVTLVDNHDTQPLQALESTVDYWFKPLAYALILLQEHGIPCIFYPAVFGAKYNDKGDDGAMHEVELVPVEGLETLIRARKGWAYGAQREYMDHPNVIGWTREGDDEHPGSGLAVVMSNGEAGSKLMEIGQRHAGKTFVDMLGKRKEKIKIGEDGKAEFYCEGGSVAVWVNEATWKG